MRMANLDYRTEQHYRGAKRLTTEPFCVGMALARDESSTGWATGNYFGGMCVTSRRSTQIRIG
jgi:hypothetical protein